MKILKSFKYIIVALVIIMIAHKPIFYLTDYVFQPHNHDIVAKENLKKSKNKEVIQDLKDKKAEYDDTKKIVENSGHQQPANQKAAQEYNEIMDDHKNLKIDKYTDLPKELKPAQFKRHYD